MAENKSLSDAAFGVIRRAAPSQPVDTVPHERQTTFTAVYDQYLSTVYHYALSRTGSIADAQDITSQTFLAAFEQFSRYQGRGKLSTWLLGIAHHKVIDHIRQKQQQTTLEHVDRETLSGLSIEASVERSLNIERVILAMRALSADRQEALSLHLFGELSIQETADVMQRTYAATQMLIQRGLTDLRIRLREEK